MRAPTFPSGHSLRPAKSHGFSRPAALLFLVAIAASVITLVSLREKRVSPPIPAKVYGPEVSVTEVTLREGRLYRGTESVPFTGLLVDSYADGLRRSRSSVSNGVLNGLSEGWHTNGLLQVREFFIDGKSHGVRTKYHPSGVHLSEANIVAGRIDGPFRRWHENGRLAEEIMMKDGQPNGVSLAYFPSGFLQARTVSSNGVTVAQRVWKDGQVHKPPLDEP